MMYAVKKSVLMAAVLSMCIASGMASAADGTVNFTGVMIAEGCTLVGAAAGNVLTVPLGTVTAATFSSVGTKSTPQTMSLRFSGCPARNINVRFDGVPDTKNNNLLALSAPNAAVGLAVGLTNPDGTALAMLTNSNIVTPNPDGSAVVTFSAFYQSTLPTVTAGTANATSNFTVIYN